MIPHQRIIGKILVTDLLDSYRDDSVSVISRSFNQYLPVASPLSLARILDAQVIDEIHLSWIGGLSDLSIDKFYQLVKSISSSISVPLAISCRLASFNQASTLFSLGADKVIIGRNLFSSASLLSQISKVYGRQSIVASLDYSSDGDLLYLSNKPNSPIKISALPSLVNNLCIGEVSLNSIDTDGSLSPHPIYSCLNVQEFNIPVLVSGGYRHHTHISSAFSSSVNGVILSSFLAKSDQSVQQIKARLINDGFRLRFY